MFNSIKFYDLYRYDVFSFRYLPILAYFLSVANCVITVVICLYPGWRRDDQAGANVNVKVSFCLIYGKRIDDEIKGIFLLDGVWFRCTMNSIIRIQVIDKKFKNWIIVRMLHLKSTKNTPE